MEIIWKLRFCDQKDQHSELGGVLDRSPVQTSDLREKVITYATSLRSSSPPVAAKIDSLPYQSWASSLSTASMVMVAMSVIPVEKSTVPPASELRGQTGTTRWCRESFYGYSLPVELWAKVTSRGDLQHQLPPKRLRFFLSHGHHSTTRDVSIPQGSAPENSRSRNRPEPPYGLRKQWRGNTQIRPSTGPAQV